MNTEFGEKLQTAINSIDSFVWKDKNGNDIKLMSASPKDLESWYNHCHNMLYNSSVHNPGKYTIRKNIHNIWDSCNTELFVRYLLNECNTNIKTKKDILDYINDQKILYDRDILSESISILFTGLDPIYEKITVSKLLDACFDKLDVINRKMINDKFILAQGIWLTDDEKIDLTETDEKGNVKNRIDVIKERLSLDPKIKIKINPNGLTFAEFRSIVQLSPISRISVLPTITLKTLRDKILLLLDNDLDYHINKWNNLKSNIRRVAEVRNISLPIYNEE